MVDLGPFYLEDLLFRELELLLFLLDDLLDPPFLFFGFPPPEALLLESAETPLLLLLGRGFLLLLELCWLDFLSDFFLLEAPDLFRPLWLKDCPLELFLGAGFFFN